MTREISWANSGRPGRRTGQRVWRALVGGLLLGLSLLGPGLSDAARAGDRTTFRGCVVGRDQAAITLHTSADERVTVDTSWLGQDALDALAHECVTVTAVTVDGRFVAESVEAGDEPNEVNGVTRETTDDRETRAREREEKEDKDKKDGEKNR